MKIILITVSCIISLSIAFYFGKNVAIVDSFAISLEELKLDIQHLEKELSKSGINARRGKVSNS